MFTPNQLEIVVDSLERLSVAGLEELYKCFPFESLLNVSVLDSKLMRLNLSTIKKLSDLDIFFNYPNNVKYCWEFTLTNILSLENSPVDDILFELLELLKHLLTKIKKLNDFTFVRKDIERVIHVLKFTIKLKIFSKPHASLCTDILSVLIETHETLPLTISHNLAEIAEVFIQLEARQGLILLCIISFNKFPPSTELYNICIPWLLNNGPQLLSENIEEDTLLLILKLFNELCVRHNHIGNTKDEKSVCNLKNMSHHIVLLSAKPVLRDESLKLLSILISECNFEDVDIKEKYITVLNKLLQLPLDVTQWPQFKSDVFFFVCSYLCTHSSLPWNSSEVIESISSLIYSYVRFTINKELLKSLCHIYPMVLPKNPSKNTLLLGDQLLIMLSRFPYSFSKIITFHKTQLVWLLKQGDPYVKKQILIEWLKRGEDLDMLEKAIMRCRVGNVLLDIITDWKLNELTDKATEMCRRIQDKELSENVAWRIPTALHDKSTLFKLILSNPGIPTIPEMALKLCEFMSLILCFIDDMKVLKAACAYSKYLVTSLKNELNVVPLFCRDIKNVQFLAIKIKYVDEETAVEILSLLKVLILVQKRNRNLLGGEVETDLSSSLIGSENKTGKCLALLQVIVTSKNVFIKLEKSKILHIFITLFNMSQDPKLAVRSFICLTDILRAHEELAHAHMTGVFVEIQCSISIDETSGPEFLTFLTVWMKILKKSFPEKLYLPDKRIISNYIQRCDFISETRAMHLLQLLNKIKQFSKNSLVKR